MPKRAQTTDHKPIPKGDLTAFATKEDLKEEIETLAQITKRGFDQIEHSFATKKDLRGFATKKDLERFATKDDLRNFATKDDLRNFATREELQQLREEIKVSHQEILFEFKVLAENIHLDVAGANHDEISSIKDNVTNHEERLATIETKVGIL